MTARGAGILVALLMIGAGSAPAQDTSVVKYPMLVRYNVRVPMRDGVRLSINVFQPRSNTKHSTVMILTPYGKDLGNPLEEAWSFVRRGYAFVSIDARGRYDSDGEFTPNRGDGPDGSDVMNWIARQRWSDGRIATYGGSYLGKVQWEMAKQNNPHHVAIMSYVSPADDWNDESRYNGVPKLDLMYTWMMGMYGRVGHPAAGFDWGKLMQGLPLTSLDTAAGRDFPFWRQLMLHDRLDAFWLPSQMTGSYGKFDIASFNVTGWYEGQLKGAVQNFTNAVKYSKTPSAHMLVVGPWLHGVNRNRVIGDRDAGPHAIINLDSIRNAWLDSRLMGAPKVDLPRVLYFLPVKNEWRSASAWPVPGTTFTSFYLASGGNANTLNGDGALGADGSVRRAPSDTFTYDPANPTPSLSSRTAGARGGLPQGSVDNRKNEERADVLVYTGEPLAEGMEVTGPLRATIYVSTNVVDTDIALKVLDVYPDGRAHNITEGIARAKYRNSYSAPELMRPGQVYKIDVELFPTSNWFEAGHRIRLEVASSDFPNFARNLNTANSDSGTEMKVAHTTILHSSQYPSAVVLPVVSAGKTVTLVP
jgi:putative CocE/NonD family hydrolase